MISIPTVLKTRADFDRALDKARKDKAPAEHVALHFIGLLESRYKYVLDQVLPSKAKAGASPEFIYDEDDQGVITQYKRVDNSQATIYTLGYTVEEVELIVGELS